MRRALIVGWKEFRTYFQTPIAYVILLVFSLLGGFFFFKVGRFFDSKEASLRTLFFYLPWLFLFLAPALSMRMWAEERRGGTIETLLTLPLRDWEITVGKFLAAVGLIAVWLVTLLPLVVVVYWFGSPDRGPIVGGFLAALLMGAAFVSIGLAASAVTENQIISLVVGVVAAFFFLLVGLPVVYTALPDALGAFVHNLSLETHFESILRGVLDSRDLLYYASFTSFFLVLNFWLVRRRKGGGVTVLLAGGVLVLANYLTTSHFFRIDLTQDHRYTLAEDTKRVLGRLDDDLRLTAYISNDVPSDFANTKRDIEDTINEFAQYANGHLRVEFVDPEASDKNRDAANAAGIQPVALEGGKENELSIKKRYLGLVVEFGSKTERIPFIVSNDTLEYDLIRRIAKMTRRGDVKIAWQVSDPMAGMNIPGMRQPPGGDKHTPTTDLRNVDQVMKEEYETTTVDLKQKIPDDVKVVALCNPEGMTETQKFWLDQFLMRGGGIIVMADGSAPQSMGGMGGPASPTMRAGNDKLPDDFFSHYGFKINKDVVLDRSCVRVPYKNQRMVPYLAFINATAADIDQSHPLTANFRSFIFTWASSITLTPKPGVKADELIKSSDQAKHLENFMMLEPESLLPQSEAQVDSWKKEYKNQYLLAGLLEGEFQSYFVAHEVPKEIVSGKPAVDPDPGRNGSPFDPINGLPPTDEQDHHDDAAGTEKKDESAPKKDAPASDPKDDGTKSGDVKNDGGPRVDDVPGGGTAQEQQAPPAPAPAPAAAPDAKKQDGAAPAPNPANPAKPDEKKPDEKKPEPKPFEYLKKSTAPGKILVIGSADFATDGTVQGSIGNAVLIQNAAGYMAAGELTGLRAKRLVDRPFDNPSDAAQAMATALGWFGTPLLLLVLLVVVYTWRRVWRPAASRRRMASAQSA